MMRIPRFFKKAPAASNGARTRVKRLKFASRYYLHEKIMRKFIRSYILVFLLPALLIYATMFYTGYDSVRKNNLTMLTTATAQTCSVLDNELYSFTSISVRISVNSHFLTVVDVPYDKLNETTTMSMYYLSRYFQDTYAISRQFSNIALYLPANEYCVSILHAVRVDKRDPDLANLGAGIIDVETWNRVISSNARKPYLTPTGNGGAVFCSRVPNIGAKYAILMIPIKSGYLKERCTLESDAQVFGGILSLNGEVIYALGDAPGTWPSELISGELKDGHFFSGGNVYTYARLENADGYMVYGSEESILNVNFWYQYNMLYLLVMLISLALFAVLTFHCAMRNFDPIKQLCDLAAAENAESENEQYDSYQKLRASLLEAVDMKRAMESSRQISREIDKGARLLRSMRTASADHLVETLFHISAAEAAQSEWTCVKATLADRFSRLFGADDADELASLDWMPLLSDLLTQALGGDCGVQPMFGSDYVLFLIRFERATNLKQRLIMAQNLLREDYSYETHIAISSRARGPRPFCDAFKRMSEECDFLIENELPLKGEDVMSYSELFQGTEKVPREAIVLERALAVKLSRGQVTQALALMDKLREQFSPLSEREDADAQAVSKDDMAQWIRAVVDKEYASPDLSVSSIADRVGRSTDTISRSFRASQGVALLDYIHQTRIRHAKVLLSEVTDVSVAAVSKMVGYTTVDSFIRVFKKIEGVTPGAYRTRVMLGE